MARQDKRRGGEPYGPDAWGLVTFLREEVREQLWWKGIVQKRNLAGLVKYHSRRVAQIKGWIRYTLAARRAIERAGK
jgi:hypothetical protein